MLDDTAFLQGVGDFGETANVGAADVVGAAAIALTVGAEFFVDAAHDALQALAEIDERGQVILADAASYDSLGRSDVLAGRVVVWDDCLPPCRLTHLYVVWVLMRILPDLSGRTVVWKWLVMVRLPS